VYRKSGSFERVPIAILATFAFGALFSPTAIAQSDAQAAKAKFFDDYNAGRYRDVIIDGELLRKNNVLDIQSRIIIGQAYYKAGDFTACARYTKSLPSSETVLKLLERCKELAPN
jgi:hypothetical protein